MAVAVIPSYTGITAANQSVRLSMTVLFSGTDITGGAFTQTVTVTFADSATLAQIAAAIKTAIQGIATAKGFTVADNNLILPSYQRI